MKKALVSMLCCGMALGMAAPVFADDQVTLTVMNVQAQDDATYTGLVEQFEEENPDIKIEHISTVNAELKKQVQVDMVSGNMPDVLQFDNPDFASFAASGYLMDITDYVNQWEDKPDYWDATIQAVTYDDKIYGLPWECNSLGLWYNQDLLDELGKDVPKTWDDVLDICKAAKEKGYYGMSMALPASEVGTFQFIPWLYAAGGSIDKLDSEASVKALDFIAGLVKDGYMSKEVLGYSHGDLQNAFLTGKTVLMENGSWCIANLKDNTSFKYGVTTLPVVNEGDTPTNCLGGYHIGISADCKNVDAAVKYLEFMSSAQSNLTWCKGAGLLPTNQETADDATFQESPWKDFVNGLPGAVARVNAKWPDLSTNVYTAIQSAVSGEKSAADALAQAESMNVQYWQ